MVNKTKLKNLENNQFLLHFSNIYIPIPSYYFNRDVIRSENLFSMSQR